MKSMKAVLMTVVPLSLLFCYFVTLLFLIVSEIVRFDFHLMFFLVFYCFHFSLLFFFSKTKLFQSNLFISFF